jgi:choline-sulfatase
MPKKNLIVLMSDEHQARAMGCAGHDFVETPHLDRLAANGMRFNNAYTPSPICVPARASFATGLYAHQTRLWDNAMPYNGEIRGWGHALQDAGVKVESIGKLHYRQVEDTDGFDAKHLPMMVVDGVGMVWASIRREHERVMGTGRMLGDYIGVGESKYTRYDGAVTERTIKWLKENRCNTQPWCLYVGLVAPHFPLICHEQWVSLYPSEKLPEPKLHPRDGHRRHPWVEKQNAFMDSEAKFLDWQERRLAESVYFGLCSWMDHNVGCILSTLEQLGLVDNTTVIYTSDHGDNVGARGLWGKSNLYEEAAAIPMIMSGPDISTGRCDTGVSLVDLGATICDHFSTTMPEQGPGESLLNIMEHDYCERTVFSEYHAAGSVSGAFMVRRGKWKYNYYIGFEAELFDLVNDPEETCNLADQQESLDIKNFMHQELLKVCDPEQIDKLAFADQDAMIERLGGRETALTLGAPGATPAPEVS